VTITGDLRPALPRLLTATALAVTSDLAGLAALLALCRVVGATASGDSVTGTLSATLVLWTLTALLGPLADLLSHRAEAQFEASLRRHLARHILLLPWSVRNSYPAEVLRRRVTDDVHALHHLVAHAPADVATFLVVPVAGVTVLVASSGPAPLVALVPAAVAAVFHLVLLPRISAALNDRRVTAVTGVVTAAEDYARGALVQRLYGAGAGAARRYREQVSEFSTAMVAWVNRSAPAAAVAEGLLRAATTLALAYAVAHDRPAEDLARVMLLSLAVTAPALKLGHGVDHIRAGAGAFRRLSALLGEPALPRGTLSTPPGPPVLSTPDAADGHGVDLRVGNVTVRAGGRKVLDGLSADFPPGSFTVVTGPSGAGKSTLLHTLAGLEVPESGSVTLDGVPVTRFDADTRPRTVLCTGQDAQVVDGTVRDNLLLTRAHPSPDGAELNRALELAGAPELDLDRQATTLSGGERQRVAVARVFLSDAPVILLDEPTSALDPERARRLVASLRALPRTVVMVTHDHSLTEPTDHRLELK